ncbi:hypothetical protein [Metabacillus bambusae]|uniref:DUF5405 domain-containing protein n=1 Tax=Metabacillus bambusae TaxID=2795218 RepID=A0ABS3N4U9_9BACI|nr:hypothetical protein [Metabacillus bambusae]MBO1513243.1 hypothetical protein [Metabacillus bambusae]
MNIKIGDSYLITSDSMNVTLNQRYEKKKDGAGTGEFDYKPIGYFSSLVHACNSLLDREIRISDAENLSELVKTIHDTKVLIKECIEAKEAI